MKAKTEVEIKINELEKQMKIYSEKFKQSVNTELKLDNSQMNKSHTSMSFKPLIDKTCDPENTLEGQECLQTARHEQTEASTHHASNIKKVYQYYL